MEDTYDQSIISFISQKTVSQHLLNTSILQNQISLLVYIAARNINNVFSRACISLIFISIFSQLLIYFLLVWLLYVPPNTNACICSSYFNAQNINAIVTFLSGLTLLINISISITSQQIIS